MVHSGRCTIPGGDWRKDKANHFTLGLLVEPDACHKAWPLQEAGSGSAGPPRLQKMTR